MNFKKEDLRVVKTQKAFHNAIKILLARRKFKQLTVNDLCEEALTSRAAFYTHYKDKYDLLGNWFYCFLSELKPKGIENIINTLMYDNVKIMQNIMHNADNETIEIIASNLVSVLLEASGNISEYKSTTIEYTILSNFCMGGFFELLKLQSTPKYTRQFQSAQKYFFDLLKVILNFHVNCTK